MGRVTKEVVKAARLSAGLKAEECGALAHCSRTTWYDWERGTHPVDIARFELFQIKVAWRRETGRINSLDALSEALSFAGTVRAIGISDVEFYSAPPSAHRGLVDIWREGTPWATVVRSGEITLIGGEVLGKADLQGVEWPVTFDRVNEMADQIIKEVAAYETKLLNLRDRE